METAQAMFNEANISRTVVVDALANRCEQLAGERAQLENTVLQLRNEIEELKTKINNAVVATKVDKKGK